MDHGYFVLKILTICCEYYLFLIFKKLFHYKKSNILNSAWQISFEQARVSNQQNRMQQNEIPAYLQDVLIDSKQF